MLSRAQLSELDDVWIEAYETRWYTQHEGEMGEDEEDIMWEESIKEGVRVEMEEREKHMRNWSFEYDSEWRENNYGRVMNKKEKTKMHNRYSRVYNNLKFL